MNNESLVIALERVQGVLQFYIDQGIELSVRELEALTEFFNLLGRCKVRVPDA